MGGPVPIVRGGVGEGRNRHRGIHRHTGRVPEDDLDRVGAGVPALLREHECDEVAVDSLLGTAAVCEGGRAREEQKQEGEESAQRTQTCA
jgi:hypothetical protein